MEEQETTNVEVVNDENVEKRYNAEGKKGFLPGNPGGGRPKGISLLVILKKKLEEIPDGEKRSWAEMYIENTLKDALKLDGQSRKMIMQYVEGLPLQKTELTHILPNPIYGGKSTESIQVSEYDSNEEDILPKQEN